MRSLGQPCGFYPFYPRPCRAEEGQHQVADYGDALASVFAKCVAEKALRQPWAAAAAGPRGWPRAVRSSSADLDLDALTNSCNRVCI